MAGICAMTARTPSSSLWHGITTLMRSPRYMRSSSSGFVGAAAGGERGNGWLLLPRQPPPRLPRLQTPPLLQYRGQHPRIEENVDREEALVRAEALGLPDEPPRRRRLRPEPDPPEVVPRVPHVPELLVDQELARVHVPVREHRAPQVPRVAGDLVLVVPHDLRDQIVPHDPFGIDEV